MCAGGQWPCSERKAPETGQVPSLGTHHAVGMGHWATGAQAVKSSDVCV